MPHDKKPVRRSRSRERDRDRERERERRERRRSRSRSKDRKKDRKRSRSRERSRERDRSHDREGDRSRDRRDIKDKSKADKKRKPSPIFIIDDEGKDGKTDNKKEQDENKEKMKPPPKKEPLSLEELLAKKMAEEDARAKPKFLTKGERAALALQKRQAEVDAMRKQQEEDRKSLFQNDNSNFNKDKEWYDRRAGIVKGNVRARMKLRTRIRKKKLRQSKSVIWV